MSSLSRLVFSAALAVLCLPAVAHDADTCTKTLTGSWTFTPSDSARPGYVMALTADGKGTLTGLDGQPWTAGTWSAEAGGAADACVLKANWASEDGEETGTLKVVGNDELVAEDGTYKRK